MSTKVTVYTIEHCPYCVRAKNLLQEYQVEYKEVRVSNTDTCTREDLFEKTGFKTFPQIFFGNKVIGGFSDLQKLDQEVGIKKALECP